MFLNVIRKKDEPNDARSGKPKKDKNVDSANFGALRSKITRICLENMT